MAKRNERTKRKKRNPHNDVSDAHQHSTSSSSSCCDSSFSSRLSKGLRVSCARRSPRVLIRHKESDFEAIALILGMSIAAFVAQVLERKDAAGERVPVDNISEICTVAVRQSLTSVFGDKFDNFVRNFEKSFQSTLMTLRFISEASRNNGAHPRLNKEKISDLSSPVPFSCEVGSVCNSGVDDIYSDRNNTTGTQDPHRTHVENENNLVYGEVVLRDGPNNQELASVSSRTPHSEINPSMLSTFENSVIEQARANDLKTFEIGLLMKKMKLKEAQFALSCDANLLERFKLSLGISKASFRAEKFKTELEDTRHSELLKRCIDCLVAGLLIMLACLGYGTYVYSHQRITEATASCSPTKQSSSWWMPNPVSSFNMGLQILRCQVQVISRMLFGVLLILAIAYLLIQRSATSKQTMPITFILLLLGVACGLAGKFCIDTLGGSGSHWLIYWEALCLLHFFSNVFTSSLFVFLHGSVVESSQGARFFPYAVRKILFYSTLLLLLPVSCGFMPFAGPSEWKDHFYVLFMDLLTPGFE